MSEHFDLVVIGAGPAGEKGAAQAAYFGKRVCLVERAPKPGGAAINTGTIPSKTLRETAMLFSSLRQRGLYGVEYRVKDDVTVADFMHRERQVVETSWQQITENLELHGITTVQGTAAFADPRSLVVTRHGQEPRTLTADTFLIATGTVPLRPAHIPFDGEVILDTDDLPALDHIPARLIIIGGGAIGAGYACTFAALGCKVTVITDEARLLTHFDSDISDLLRQEFTRRFGMQVVLGLEAIQFEVSEGLAHVVAADGAAHVAEAVLFCGGREGATRDLQLERAGVAVGRNGEIIVDEKFRTSMTHILAAGAVIGAPGLVSTSMEQARVAVCNAFNLRYKHAVSSIMPQGVWTIPEAAYVGLTEQAARAADIAYETGRASFRHNARGQIIGETEGLVKLVFGVDDQVLLGATIVGEGAIELIHVASAVIAMGGTIDYFIQATFAYPSLADAYKYAAYDGLQRIQRRISDGGGLKSAESPR